MASTAAGVTPLLSGFCPTLCAVKTRVFIRTIRLQGNHVSSSKSNLMGLDVIGPLALQSLDGFILLINSEGLIQFVSENVEQYLGQKPAELESRNIFELVHRDDASKFSTNLRLVDSHQVRKRGRPQALTFSDLPSRNPGENLCVQKN